MKERPLAKRLKRLVLVALALFVVSVVGYMVIEDHTFPESLYMTVITLSTVGFGEVRPLSTVGRLFTVGVIIIGVGTGAYLFSTVAD